MSHPSSKRRVAVGLAVCASLASSDAFAKTIYVTATGDDAKDGSTPAMALRSLQAAAKKTAPGDIVEVDDGTYAPFTIATSGTDAAWIHFVAKAGAKPKVDSKGWNAILIESAHHIEIRGFEVVGPMASKTLEQCTADADAATPDPLCNGNGISIDSRKVEAKAHHILIADNDVHDCPGAGISAIEADYVVVERNLVHGNSLHTRYGASGISYLTSWNFDDTTGVKMIVRQNRVFGNKTLVKWVQIQKLSDGNGIIIDTSRNTGTSPAIAPYKGRFLVENNVSVGNGGSGIHAYDSEHVDIIHNTTYQNGQVVGYAEIFANNSNDVQILNNVMIGRADGGVNTNDTRSTARYDYNVYFAGKVNSRGASDIVGDPKVLSPSLDLATADFRLAPGSPAIDSATPTLTSAVDLLGAVRPAGSGPDRGAYELGAALPGTDAGLEGGSRDAGVTLGDAEASGSTASTDASIRDGGGAAAAAPADSNGCSCRTAPAPRNYGALLLSAVAAVAALRRRRTRSL